ncbi:MAG: HlyC/CorC family transporter [Candidatus Xiphinematobacter sp.]|nr:MAG: HlyC/CorC family transporter [Candidatus Xiphinematobacter sp.]QQY10999.1 MAG: HlyC/CorC family transporter [Candidatus Xiphinematobacter sp.]
MNLAVTRPFLVDSPGRAITEWDFPDLILFKFCAIFLLVLVNSFFVASEFAIVKVRSTQLETLLEGGNRAAQEAKKVTSSLDAYLSATQLGITIASLALGWIGEPFLASMIAPLIYKVGIQTPAIIHGTSTFFGLLTVTIVHIVFGEMTPKSLAICKALPITLFVSRPLQWFHWLFRPFIQLLNWLSSALLRHVLHIQPAKSSELVHSEEELRMILSESEKSEKVTSMGKEFLINILDLRRRVVRDIMTPRGEVVYLDVEEPFNQEIRRAITSRHTRLPLCRGHLDNSFGLVHIKDLLALVYECKTDWMAIRRDLLHVSEIMGLEKLLRLFLNKHAHLAVAVDEYGGAVGIVTLDNILEEIVGSIQDEFDTRKQEFQKISEQEFTVDGVLALYELAEMASLNFGTSEVSTIGGYITSVLGHIPFKGEHVCIGDYLATVIDTDGRRVLRVHFKKLQ